MGLQAGADDYMTKPVRQMELFARIMALVRRYDASADDDKPTFFIPYTFAHEDFSVAYHETKAQLTSKEFELSLFLFCILQCWTFVKPRTYFRERLGTAR